MALMDEILENVGIGEWVKAFARSPAQANAPHESDAELVELPGNPDVLLAVTIDTISEEILEGLYEDPYTMGWVAAMASLSDLAAVGADPLGILLSASVPPDGDDEFVERGGRGVEEACRTLGVFVLGGDTNSAQSAAFTGCAVGTVPRGSAITRRGLEPGNPVYLSGRAGVGNALGLAKLARLGEGVFPEERYRPTARLALGRSLRGVARACMDTSDGVLTTLDQLMRLNGFGFEIECEWERLLAPDVLEFCGATGTPPWMMLAGPHGEFELVFAVAGTDGTDAAPPWAAPARPDIAPRERDAEPLLIGTVQERPALTLVLPSGQRTDVGMARARNLLESTAGDLSLYVREFRKLGAEWGLE